MPGGLLFNQYYNTIHHTDYICVFSSTAFSFRLHIIFDCYQYIYNADIFIYLSKVQSELDSVVGRDRSPSMQDRRNLPYTEAVISEAQRMCDVLPMGVPHAATEDTVIKV